MSEQHAYEKLDLFYLGRELDIATGESTSLPLLYKNKNLTTHAAIIGMTGSGKTGLGIGLIEEAALDRLPAIVIDPKGDMANLLLTFPDLAAADFKPWVDPAEAERRGVSVDELAAATARTWEQGIGSWDQDRERIRTLKQNAEFTVYTPGSSIRPVSVLGGLEAPPERVVQDDDTMNSLVNATVTSLLALIGIRADPLKSREHILLSSILLHHWRLQEDLSLEALIGMIVTPPFERIGVFGLDTFYPQDRRMELAMQLNNVLASPGFSAWISGDPLDIGRMLYTPEGKPRISVFSIAHLSETERMFFVTMLLSKFISWMRRQEGAGTLKALLYMDEIFGYFPPSANPPSKKPMLLLLKQARAYGIGIVLATQNPVDLDYKGLANIGTWFVGRLQTPQDQDRVMSGLEGSGVHLDKKRIRELLTDMRGRTFLMSCVHRDEPVLFETRWVLSYLKGPISLSDISRLPGGSSHGGTQEKKTSPGTVAAAQKAADGFSNHPPLVSGDIKQRYLPAPLPIEEDIRLTPWLAAEASLRFFNQKRNIDQVSEIKLRLRLDDSFSSPRWSLAEPIPYGEGDFRENPTPGSLFAPLPPELSGMKNLRGYAKEFSDYLYQNMRLELFRVPRLGLESRPGEPESEFRVRVADFLREKKEIAVDKLQERFGKKQQKLEQRLDRALIRLDKEKDDVKARGMDTAVSFGVAIFGALFGRKPFSVTTVRRGAGGVRSAGRMIREKGDVARAEEAIAAIRDELETLALELEEKIAEQGELLAPENYPIETFAIKPRRQDIFDISLYLLWEPVLDLPGLQA